MKIKVFRKIIIYFFLFAQYIHAQNNVQGIRGKITDQQTFKPLISANIIIAETNYGTSSKVDGSFEIIGLPEGKYELHISMIGYYPINRIIVPDYHKLEFYHP